MIDAVSHVRPLLPPLIAAIGLLGCASQPRGPYYGDEQYLVLGVKPDAEAVAVTQQLETTGYQLTRQFRGQYFTALGFTDEEGTPSKVRVVTARGIALALDRVLQTDLLHEGMRYELLPPPLRDTHDADGDGFEEVFVESQPESGEPPCILVYRVRDAGFVDEVSSKDYTLGAEPDATADAWRDPRFCDAKPAAVEDEAASPASPTPPSPAEPTRTEKPSGSPVER